MTDRRQFFTAAAIALAWPAGRAQDPAQDPAPLYPKTIVLVRHAEKTTEPADDPALSEAGITRATALATMLGKSGVTHLFASEFERTQATLRPLAQATGVAVTTAQAADRRGLTTTIDKLPAGAVVVVAGHSNTVPALLAALTGGQQRIAMTEAEYDRLFVVTKWGAGPAATVLELRYQA